MPIYTYECQSCSSSLERRQGFHDEPLKIHDDCGGNLRRVIYPAGIVFKGSGFYNTDYKSSTSSNKPSDAADAKTESKSESSTSESSASTTASSNGSGSGDSSAAKTESKPAAPATTAT